MKNYTDEEIAKLQRNLSLIRNAGGWTMEQFGDMIGVTKQTISNLEKDFDGKPTMSKTQYIAIRAVLDYEINANPDNTLLRSTVNLCLNKDDNLSKEDREKIKAFVSGAKKTGLDDATIVGGVAALLGIAAVSLLTPVALAGALPWLAKIIKKNK